MSTQRLERLSAERRERLFRTAAEEFGTQGYEGASLNRIIARAGFGKSSLYYYFEDKQDLFGQLVQSVFGHFVRFAGGLDYRTLTAESFWPEIEALFLKGIAFSEAHPWYVRVGQLFYRVRSSDKRGGTTGRLMALAEGWVASLLHRGMELGVVRADLPADLLVASVMALVEVCDRYLLETWSQQTDEDRRKLVDQQMGLLKRVCLPVAA